MECSLSQPQTHFSTRYTISEEQLQALVSRLKCPKRGCNGRVQVIPTTLNMDASFIVECTSCGEIVSDAPPRKVDGFSEYNLVKVYISLISGVGRGGLLKSVGFHGEAFSSHTYITHCSYLFKKMKPYYEELMEVARKKVREYYHEELDEEEDDNGNVAVAVTFDGTWMTRGHKSHIGCCFVLDAHTRTVIDMEVLCNYCIICKEQKDHVCHMNFDGKAGAMEKEGALRLWSRSLQHKMKYVTFVGDGDSSAHSAVMALNDGQGPYDVPVIKEECINHVSKRLGTRLRKLKKETSEVITTKTGKQMKRSVLGGARQLTDDIINKLSSYYGKAIRDNVGKTYQEMKAAVFASYWHLCSTEEKPTHHFCPKDADSWCFYNRAKARNETTQSHAEKNLYLAKLPLEKLELIRGVYKDLVEEKLLKRCLQGFTQNPNESLHSKLWSKASKTKHAGRFRITFLSRVTVLQHNFGNHVSLITHLFGTNQVIKKAQQIQEHETVRVAVKTSKRKRKLDYSDEYQPGNF